VKLPRLIVVTDTTVAPLGVLEERVERVLSLAVAETVMVQLRDPSLGVRDRLRLGARLRDACRRHGQWFVVRDRVDLAVLLDADGVHLAERSIAAADARSLLRAGAWVSRAWHDAQRAPPVGVDAVLLSPALAARKGRPALGPSGIAAFRSLIGGMASRPALYALGGIDAAGVPTVLNAGADGVAVIGAALRASDPTALLAAVGALEPPPTK
jgi:thiamine-phosphate pyrophosphorylase